MRTVSESLYAIHEKSILSNIPYESHVLHEEKDENLYDEKGRNYGKPPHFGPYSEREESPLIKYIRDYDIDEHPKTHIKYDPNEELEKRLYEELKEEENKISQEKIEPITGIKSYIKKLKFGFRKEDK